MRERGLAEAGRAVEQHVIERLATLPRRGDGDVQVLADRSCPMYSSSVRGRSPALVLGVVVDPAGRDKAVSSHCQIANIEQKSGHVSPLRIHVGNLGILAMRRHVLERRLEARRRLCLQDLLDRFLRDRPLITEIDQR